jgi:hypothetical protein
MMSTEMMSYEIVFTEIFAGCLFAAAAAFRVRLGKVRNAELRTKVGRRTFQNVPYRTK